MKFSNTGGKIILCLSLLTGGCAVSMAQEETAVAATAVEEGQITIPSLFEYVTAPDDLPDLTSRTNYLMEHFWEPFDFKKEAVDQTALNHAFDAYATAMTFASPDKVEKSVKELIKKIKNNPGLTYQFTKAAEESFFGQRADFWNDDIYLAFIDNLLANKKISDNKKKRFLENASLLRRCAIGARLPEFTVVDSGNATAAFTPSSDYTLIEFIPPVSEDGLYSNLKLDISSTVNDLIEDGKLKVVLVTLDDKFPVGNFPDKWDVYYSNDAKNIMDLRINPSFYILGKDQTIQGKNLTVDDAITVLEYLINQEK